MKNLFYFFCVLGTVWFFGLSFLKALDQTIESQDRMLCESAKISGNREYRNKCECYYKGEDIKCLQKKN